MKKTLILVGLMSLASAFAAPSFTYVKDAAMNGMMMAKGTSEHIELAAAPSLKLQARAISEKHAIFFYNSTNVISDAQAAYEFYQGALLEHGWKAGDAMMAGDAMAGDAMKKDDAMMSDKDKMAGKDAMAGKDDAMMAKDGKGDAMMAKGIFEGTLTQGGHTITIKIRPNGNRVEVDLVLM